MNALEAESQSPGGGRHKSTLLMVMSDHGQTLTGDHGGGTPEEVGALAIHQKHECSMLLYQQCSKSAMLVE